MLASNSLIDEGRFQLVDTIGKGATAVAYLGYDTRSTITKPKYYAVKCLSRLKNDSAALVREIRLHKLVCTHPGIVTIRRSLAEGPYQLVIMDYYSDGDLFYQITQRRTIAIFRSHRLLLVLIAHHQIDTLVRMISSAMSICRSWTP